jgi:hypothetical protein
MRGDLLPIGTHGREAGDTDGPERRSDDVTAPPWMPEFRAALEAGDVAKMADILGREMGRIGRRL